MINTVDDSLYVQAHGQLVEEVSLPIDNHRTTSDTSKTYLTTFLGP